MPIFKNIAEYQSRLRVGTTSCVEAVSHYLEVINDKKHLNAMVDVFEKESLERAKTLDKKLEEGKPCGKLFGVVLTIKDVICYKDHRVTAGSASLRDFISIYSATAVENLLKEDAIIIGTCNCDEFAMGSTNENTIHGRVKNPVNEEKVPGGSSGGSAAAVKAGMCMAAIGSDTGGSVRQPADFCGIVGFKPTYGRISRHGLLAYASSFDQIGILANNVEDTMLILEAISGHDKYDSTMLQEGPVDRTSVKTRELSQCRIGLIRNLIEHPALDPYIKDSILTFASDIKKEGAIVEEVELELTKFLVPAYYILTTAEASSNLSRYDGVRYGLRVDEPVNDIITFYKKNRSAGFGKEVKKRIMLGTFVLSEGYFDAYYNKALQFRRLLSDKIEVLFEKYDYLLLPTVPETAYDAGSMQKDPVKMYLADIYTIIANLTGTPAISLPIFYHNNGMPFGVQLMANKYNDVSLLSFSKMMAERQKQELQKA